MAEYSQRLSPCRQAQVHEQRIENPLKSVSYYRTQERSLIDKLGGRKVLKSWSELNFNGHCSHQMVVYAFVKSGAT